MQIPLNDESRAEESVHGGVHRATSDLAYIRTVMVNVVFHGQPEGSGWTLIDAGIGGSGKAIEAAARSCFGDRPPEAIVLTHGHFDHVGALVALAERWDVPIYAHPLEHPYLTGKAAYPDGDPTVGGGMMASLSGFYPTHPIDVSRWLRALPENGSIPSMPAWRWIHTPGHSPGHVSLFRDSDRSLIAGDAVVTTKPESVYATIFQTPELHGPPQYLTIDWNDARASVQALAGLRPDLLISGHGRAMQGPDMTAALEELSRNFDRLAIPSTGRYVEKPALVRDGSAYVDV